MRKEELYQAIGELDEKILYKSETGWKPSRVFRTALTAAACLLLAVGIGSAAFFGFGRDSQGEAFTPDESFVVGSEETDSMLTAPGVHGEISWNESDMLLSDNGLYFSTYTYAPEQGKVTDPGVFLYDPAAGSAQQLGYFPAKFTRTQSGEYGVDISTGEVCDLDDGFVGTIPTDAVLIDVLGDTIYYHAGTGVHLYALDTASGRTRELYSNADSGFTIQDCYLRDWVIYYRATYMTANPEFYALDLNTGEHRSLDFQFPKGALYHVYPCAYFDDCILLAAMFYDDDSGYNFYRLDYDTLEVTGLSWPAGYTMQEPINRDGDTLYISYKQGIEPYRKVLEYDLVTGEMTEWEKLFYSDYVVAGPDGCYYDDNREEYPGLYFYNAATGQTTRIDPGTQSDAKTVSTEEATAEPSEDTFFALFHELDESSVRAYLDAHPDVLNDGWGGIDIDASGLTDAGTDIRTKNGDQVLAVNAKEGVLLIRVEVEDTRGVLAIGKDTAQLRLCAAETLGTEGQTVGTICENNGGVLAITGSAFIDPNGDGNGGTLSGLMVSGGETYGTALGGDYKRLELREDDRMYIVDSDSAVADGTRDAVEFQPAAIVDGEIVVDETWNGFNPRALIGQSERLETMMLVMEGRLLDSVGRGVEDCAKILKEYGCAQALNLDGGTSAMMYYQGKCVTCCSNTDLPDGRTLPSAWVYGKTE